MNRIRRPWAPSRRDTDGVQLNTLSTNGKTADASPEQGTAEKLGFDEPTTAAVGPDIEHGHLQEIEVDVAHILQDKDLKDISEDTSPYPEVRAVVPETDDPDMPVNTLRMWILGVIWTLIGAGVNQFFSLRYPAVHIVSIVAELLAFPMGVFLAHVLPLWTLDLGPLGRWCVNPDRHFNIKEHPCPDRCSAHVVIVIMANVTIGFAGGADATGIIQAAIGFYGFKLSAGFSVLVTLCCQTLGFGVAGLCHQWLVEPAAIIWPGILSNCALLNTLHSRANAMANGWRISRLKFFSIVATCAFVWYWFPGLIFVALSYFTWVCWIAPKNIVVNQLFGMESGLGLFPLTFDWSQVAYNTNPLLSPSWAAMNVFGGFIVAFWIIAPALYYTNTWYTAYLPMMTADVYDNTGASYNVTKVLTEGGTLDPIKYAAYSPPYLSVTFAFVYGLSFASITAVIVHVYLWHGKDILDAIRGRQPLDIHGRLMRAYEKVPRWWYCVILVVFTALSIVLAEIYHTDLPVYGVFLALIIPAIYMVPCGIIQGVSNVDANQLNVLSEFVGGYMFAGKPLANMIFKILSEDVVAQGIFFAQDQKLGHYFKVAPKIVFFAQGFAVVLGALTQAGVTIWMLGNIDGICSTDQSDGFTCPNGRTVFSSSVIWGLIGPKRLYSVGTIYSGLLHFFWIGALMPIITWALWKYYKKDWLKNINWPLIFVGTYNVPPATGINYSSWAIVNLIFNHWIKEKFYAWWAKYNYILAAGLDFGTAISGIIIFFAVSYPGYSFPDWWGNTVYLNTADGDSASWLPLPDRGYFGAANGTGDRPLSALMAIPYTVYPSLREKVVVITGGAEGIGAAAVELFCRQGSKVAFLDIAESSATHLIDRIKDLSQQLSKEQSQALPPVTQPDYFQCNVTDLTRLKQVAEEILAKYGTVHVLVNNAALAGAVSRKPTAEITPESWESTINVNLRHQFFLSQYLLPAMQNQRSGSIINIGSIAWRIPSVGLPVYATAKAAIMGLTKTHSKEYGGYNIRVNSVMPGAIATERQINEVLTEEYRTQIFANQSLKRDLLPKEAANVILFLASDDSSGVTGSNYVVDGGWVGDV
ncbi:small oligopeptide transporter [Teratosphaeria destructans]|uniref:Small oligopeptide transporter n=1 Tax=Teratosphaeria destructans TaxID=418781 RepID=A0A9W7W0I3_9PEZI|nr:small oligopeptide transporter [Teratosphaeria destructans]